MFSACIVFATLRRGAHGGGSEAGVVASASTPGLAQQKFRCTLKRHVSRSVGERGTYHAGEEQYLRELRAGAAHTSNSREESTFGRNEVWSWVKGLSQLLEDISLAVKANQLVWPRVGREHAQGVMWCVVLHPHKHGTFKKKVALQ